MPKKYRLTGEELKKISERGELVKRLHGSFFSLSYASIGLSHGKIATIVSKKVASKAVERNRIKRRARAVLESLIGRWRGAPYALMLYAKKTATEAPFSEIKDDVTSLIAKIPNARS